MRESFPRVVIKSKTLHCSQIKRQKCHNEGCDWLPFAGRVRVIVHITLAQKAKYLRNMAKRYKSRTQTISNKNVNESYFVNRGKKSFTKVIQKGFIEFVPKAIHVYQGESPKTDQICNRKQTDDLDIFIVHKFDYQHLTNEQK